MRSLKTGLSAALISGVALAAAIVGCSADGGSTVVTEPEPTEPPGAVLPEPGEKPDNTVDAGKDSGKKDSGTKTDSGPPDAGPPPPTPGTKCPKDGDKQKKPCGACGTQETVCIDEGTGLKWSEYGLCGDELLNGCIPGTVVDEPCGNCGTVKKTCTKFCAYTSGACTGQPALNCKAGTAEYSTAGCTVAQTYRMRECSATCTWGSYSACETPTTPNKMTISATVGGVVSTDWTLAGATKRPSTSTCPQTTALSSSLYKYAAVEVTNPSATKTAEITAYQSKSATGVANLDMVMWTYAGSALPMTDATLQQCAKGVADECPEDGDVAGNICGNTGSNIWYAAIETISIPPGGKVLVFSAPYGTSTPVGDGTFTLNLKTTKLQ